MDQMTISTVWVVAYEDKQTNVFTTRVEVFSDQGKATTFLRALLLSNIERCSRRGAQTIRAILDDSHFAEKISDALAAYYSLHFAERCGDLTWGAFNVNLPEFDKRA